MIEVDVQNVLFVTAGMALLAHVALSLSLQRRLTDRPDVLQALFANPNRFMAKESSFRLLRARYYLCWRKLPEQVNSIDSSLRKQSTLARLTGLLMPVCALGFLGAATLQALG